MVTFPKKKKILSKSGGGASPFGKVQSAAPAISPSGATSINVPFATPPAVGNAIVVAIIAQSNNTADTVTDNSGNTYGIARVQAGPSAGMSVIIRFCSKLTAVTLPFSITVTGTSRMRVVQAIEVGGEIAVDQVVSTEVGTVGWTSGPTPALTADKVFVVAALVLGTASQNGITATVVTPPWTEEVERLTPAPVGEIDSRLLTGVVGTTQSISWTTVSGVSYGLPTLVAFKAS